MFQSARLKLTAWYLLIIMTISIFFSYFIYNAATYEVERALRRQQLQFYSEQGIVPPPPYLIQIDPTVLQESETQIWLRLLTLNLIIFGFSGGIGYLLSGRTLRPIETMITEQKRFISDASHELRTPLTALKSEIEVNLRGKNLSAAKARQILQSNLEEVNSLQMLSESLLRLTQYEDSTGWKFTKIPIEKVIRGAWDKVSVIAKEKKITMEIKQGETYTLGDMVSLIELFIILFDNAVKYSGEKSRVTVSIIVRDGWMHILVQDEGIGIHPDDVSHIFDRFYRSDTSRSKQSTTGYGLGLSIAKKIVAVHKGSISVESRIGEGTTFAIKLPHIKNV